MLMKGTFESWSTNSVHTARSSGIVPSCETCRCSQVEVIQEIIGHIAFEHQDVNLLIGFQLFDHLKHSHHNVRNNQIDRRIVKRNRGDSEIAAIECQCAACVPYRAIS